MNINTSRSAIQRGYGSEERPVVRVLWERDSKTSAPALQAVGNVDPANPNVDFTRYYDPDFAKREFEAVFMKSWLFACREEDIPKVGDRVPFQVGPRSFFIIRNAANSFKAFYNSCLHRGTKLCAQADGGSVIRCPYHAWEWTIDGALKSIPSHWDFKEMKPANGKLREVHLARWGGFIFINADPTATPLEEALSVVPEHLQEFAFERRFTSARFRKTVPANWKIAQEAFQESYHVLGTHPEGIPFNGDSQSQYDIWESSHGQIGRQVTPSAVPSMHANSSATPADAAMVFAKVLIDWHYPGTEMPVIDPSQDIRRQLAAWHRKVWQEKYGRLNDLPDAAMLDSTLYFVFPHFTIWLSEPIPFVYQFTPHETNPELSYFEVRLMLPYDESKAPPPSSPAVEVGLHETIFQKAPAFGFLGYIIDQDMTNMPLIQAGAKSADPARNHSQLGTYQESIIQHWHATIDRLMERGAPE